MSISDLKKGEIHHFFLIGLMDFHYPIAYSLIPIIRLLYPFIEHYCGGADLLIIALLFTRYQAIFVFNIMFYASLLGLFYYIFFGKREIKFIPFILGGFIISSIL